MPPSAAALAELALEAMAGRSACLLANHGMIVLGESLAKAMWRAVELEALARQYLLSLQAGGPVLLSDAEIEETLARFADYGVRGEG
jgi:L-fuculose-phosphate aldolase